MYSLGTTNKMWKKRFRALSPIPHGKHSNYMIKYNVGCRFICVLPLLDWRNFFLFFFFADCFYGEQVLNFVCFLHLLTWSHDLLLMCELYCLIFECWTNTAFLGETQLGHNAGFNFLIFNDDFYVHVQQKYWSIYIFLVRALSHFVVS